MRSLYLTTHRCLLELTEANVLLFKYDFPYVLRLPIYTRRTLVRPVESLVDTCDCTCAKAAAAAASAWATQVFSAVSLTHMMPPWSIIACK